jgi:hypothetical protein
MSVRAWSFMFKRHLRYFAKLPFLSAPPLFSIPISLEFGVRAFLAGGACRFRQAAQEGEFWSIQNTERVFRSHIETASVTSFPH